jgi:hypothetical protein
MDDLTEGSILDLNHEWKPIGLVKKYQKTKPFTITIFFFLFSFILFCCL